MLHEVAELRTVKFVPHLRPYSAFENAKSLFVAKNIVNNRNERHTEKGIEGIHEYYCEFQATKVIFLTVHPCYNLLLVSIQSTSTHSIPAIMRSASSSSENSSSLYIVALHISSLVTFASIYLTDRLRICFISFGTVTFLLG